MAGPAATRLGDKAESKGHVHWCYPCTHGAKHDVVGPFVMGSPNVMTNSRPAIRQDDPGMHMICCFTNMYKAVGCSATVFIDGKGAVRKGDQTQHCEPQTFMGEVIDGSGDVFIGD